MDKPRILFLMHMPPPVHGAAVMGGIVRDSEVIRERFECRFVNRPASRDLPRARKCRAAADCIVCVNFYFGTLTSSLPPAII